MQTCFTVNLVRLELSLCPLVGVEKVEK